MIKKGVVLASAVAAAVVLGGCAESKQQPMPHHASAYQSGHSAKLGKMGGSSCKGKSVKKHSDRY